MKIYRIDATFPGDEVERDGAIVEDVVGMLTVFAQTAQYCETRRRGLDDAGWEFDVYREEIGEVPPEILQRLVLSPWPVLPTALILELCASPLPIAREQLDALLTARGLPQWKTAPPPVQELTYEPCDN